MRQLTNSEWSKFSQVDRERIAFWFQQACATAKSEVDRVLVGTLIDGSTAVIAKTVMRDAVLGLLRDECHSLGLQPGTCPPWSLAVETDEFNGRMGIWVSLPIHPHACDMCAYVASYYTGELDDVTPGDMNKHTVVDSYVCERFQPGARVAELVSHTGIKVRPLGVIESMIARRHTFKIEGVDLFWAETFLRYQRTQQAKQGN